MKLLFRLLLLPFKFVDEALEILLLRVLFHRRLWIINVPLTIGLSFWGYRYWQQHHSPPPPPKSAAVAVHHAPSPAPRVVAVTPLVPPSPLPSALPRVQNVDPRPKTPAAPAQVVVATSLHAAAVPSPRPSIAAAPAPVTIATAAPRSPMELLVDRSRDALASQSATQIATAAVDLVAAMGASGGSAARAAFDQLSHSANPSVVELGLLGQILQGDTQGAALLPVPLPLEILIAGLRPHDCGLALLAELRHGDRERRLTVLDTVGWSYRPVPTEIIPYLVTMLGTKDTEVSCGAARILARVSDRSYAGIFQSVLAKVSEEEQACLRRSLAAMHGPMVKEELIRGMASRSNAVRAQCLNGLVEVTETGIDSATLDECGRDPDYTLRLAAIRFQLETPTSSGATELLTRELTSELEPARCTALQVVASLSERVRCPTIIALLGDKTLSSSLRMDLLRILARSPFNSATPSIQKLLGHKREQVRWTVATELSGAQVRTLRSFLFDRLEKEDSPAVRAELAAKLLSETPRASDVLTQIVRTSPASRPRALSILAQSRAPSLAVALAAVPVAERGQLWCLSAQLVTLPDAPLTARLPR